MICKRAPSKRDNATSIRIGAVTTRYFNKIGCLVSSIVWYTKLLEFFTQSKLVKFIYLKAPNIQCHCERKMFIKILMSSKTLIVNIERNRLNDQNKLDFGLLVDLSLLHDTA